MDINDLVETNTPIKVNDENYIRVFNNVLVTLRQKKMNENLIDFYKPHILRSIAVSFLNNGEELKLVDYVKTLGKDNVNINFDFKNALRNIVNVYRDKDKEYNPILINAVLLETLKSSISEYNEIYIGKNETDFFKENLYIFDMETNLDFYLNVLGFEITFLILENLRRL